MAEGKGDEGLGMNGLCSLGPVEKEFPSITALTMTQVLLLLDLLAT